MNEQDKEEFLKLIKDFNKEHKDELRIVYVNETYWKNVITLKKGVVKDLFFLGVKNSSSRPRCILGIVYDGKEYRMHQRINHVNFQSEKEDYYSELNGKDIKFIMQEFCNPINSHKVYTEPNIDKMLKGQIMGQNANSRYQTVEHVVNEGYDYVVRANGAKLKCNAPILELLTKRHAYELKDMRMTDLENYPIPKNENEVAVKSKNDSSYMRIYKDDLEKYKAGISEYYPIITYEQCVDILNNIPKQEVDMTVIGLGSAGTGILDQVARSTYFENYLLVDFDEVERKNLRNQWYTSAHVGMSKTGASHKIIRMIKPDNVLTKHVKFQDAGLELFKTKYVVSGFDNLECRVELLDKCLKDFESRYLIDLRYLDYSCSIYFVDLQDEKQVKYYRNLLQADIDGFKEQEKDKKYITTKEEFVEWFSRKGGFKDECESTRRKYMPETRCVCPDGRCGSGDCINNLYKEFVEAGAKIEKEEQESSCIRENFIDIYKYSSSFVFAAIREIEAENDKPFTHIEAQTEVIPTSVIVRR